MRIISLLIGFLLAILAKARPGGHGEHEHVKFIIPVHEKTIKHTHTIYKTIYHKVGGGGGDLGHSHGGLPHGWDHGWH